MNQQLQHIARQFAGGQTVIKVAPLGNGLINDTFCVTSSGQPFVLQRINQQVFPQPELVMVNLLRLSQHIAAKAVDSVQLQIPTVIASNQQQPYFKDEDQQVWRALQLISPAESREHISRDSEAQQVGFALAHFHRLCSDLPVNALHDTLPGFHITPRYYQAYQALMAQPLAVDNDSELQACLSLIDSFASQIDMLEHAKQQGLLVERVIHGDPKLNNFLFQPNSDQIISLIDLDTVKPGLVHYDIGDCLRSCCHIAESNQFDLHRCQLILQSYLQEAGHFFSRADYEYLYLAIVLIPFELGLRFLTDYLQGNRYFKVKTPRQNLQRAQAQFALAANIVEQRLAIEAMIKRLAA